MVPFLPPHPLLPPVYSLLYNGQGLPYQSPIVRCEVLTRCVVFLYSPKTEKPDALLAFTLVDSELWVRRWLEGHSLPQT